MTSADDVSVQAYKAALRRTLYMISKPDPRQSPYWRDRADLSKSRFNLEEAGHGHFALSSEALEHYNRYFGSYVGAATELVASQRDQCLVGKMTYTPRFTSSEGVVTHIMKNGLAYAEERLSAMTRETVEMYVRASYYLREYHRANRELGQEALARTMKGIYDTRYKSFLECNDRLRYLARRIFLTKNPSFDTTSPSAPAPNVTTTATGSPESSQGKRTPPSSPLRLRRNEPLPSLPQKRAMPSDEEDWSRYEPL